MAKRRDYYKGGHRVLLGGVPCRLARLPIGPAGIAMLRETSREMCLPRPPRERKAFLKWEREQVASYALALGILEKEARKRIARQVAIMAPVPERLAA